MKKRSGFQVMSRLIGLVKPLAGYMFLAVFMGLVGHLCAAFITIFGSYAVLEALHFDTPFILTAIFVCVVVLRLYGVSSAMRNRRATISSPSSCWLSSGTRYSGRCVGSVPPSWRAGIRATSFQ